MIGNENLPNVYIDKIILSEETSRLKIEVYTSMFDRITGPLWRGRDKTSSLRIKIKLSDDLEEIRQLNTGERSLFSSESSLNTKILSTVDGLEVDTSNLDNFPENMIKLQYYSVFYYPLLDNSSLNVYAACFLDFNGFPDNKEMNKYYGPMTAEIVLQSNVVPPTSQYFTYSDTGREYAGPVHQHNQGYMEGSVHSERPHRALTLINEENFKVIDTRSTN